MTHVALPHQLFDARIIPSKSVILWEHPRYFTRYRFNKKKLLLHRASMRRYRDELVAAGHRVRYVEFHQDPPAMERVRGRLTAFDPLDRDVLPGCVETQESPNVLLSDQDRRDYRARTRHFIFNNFYMWAKRRLDCIPDVKSRDKHNRKALPRDFRLPADAPTRPARDQRYVDEARRYVERHFPDNPGNVDGFVFPISRSHGLAWLRHWIRHKFARFGDYQDAMHDSSSLLFHSGLSSTINVGLLQPAEILKTISQIQDRIPLNSYEGYVRQLFWREYQLYCYRNLRFNRKNYLGHTKRLTRAWYRGTLGIEPVDSCIRRGFATGYLNHIERLMIVGNFMNLRRIHPRQGLRWFMEMSCDSYEWVMVQNVLDMVFFVTGGVTMRRPYVSSSNYVRRMGTYKPGPWCDKWDDLYRRFKTDLRDQLWKFRYHFPGLQ